jgi:hypothetical protein
MISLTSRAHEIRSKLTCMKRDLKRHYDNFELFPLYCAGFGQLFSFLVTCKKIDGGPKAIAMRLLVLPAKKIQDSLSGFIHNFFGGGKT